MADELACEECGSTTNVTRFHGRETCEKDDEWLACFECRWPYLRTRVWGPEAEGPPGDVRVPE